MKSKLGIVIVNWNSDKYVDMFLANIKKQNHQNFYVVLVNNDVRDNNAFEKYKSEKLEVINTNANLGYSGGINAGLKRLKEIGGFDYFLIINNDVEFEADFFEKLMENCGDTEMVSPVIVYHGTDIVQNTGGRISTLVGGTLNLNKNRKYSELKKIQPDFLSGCCMLLNANTLEKVGYFDEIYGSYYEDVDFCYRAKQLGLKLKILWDTKMQHYHSVSTKGMSGYKLELITRNSIIFAKKNLKFPGKWVFIIAGLVRGLVLNISQLSALFKGIWSGCSS